MTNIDFERAFRKYPRVRLYLNYLPKALANSGFQIDGYLCENDATGVVLAFMSSDNEPRLFKFMTHVVVAIEQTDISQLVVQLKGEKE